MIEHSVETCAVLFTYPAAHDRIVVHDGGVVPDHAYRQRTDIVAVLTPDYVFEVVHEARQRQAGIVLAHSHTDAHKRPIFSDTDDAGEKALQSYLDARTSDAIHVALVIGPEGMRARRLGSKEEIRIEEVGSTLRVCFDPTGVNDGEYSAIYDRQVRAFGAAGQRVISRMKVGIVGLGRTGSVVAQELAHIGVGHFVLIDSDDLENSNRNRVVGSAADDVGRAKVAITKRLIHNINKQAVVVDIKGTVLDPKLCELLTGVGFIFICTDSHSSRAIVSKLSYQYFIPGIDIGVSISAKDGVVEYIEGRAQMNAPGLPYLD